MSDKYVVLKAGDWEMLKIQVRTLGGASKKYADVGTGAMPTPIPDAVVIRRQDVFAAPALDAYANAIQCVIEALHRTPSHPNVMGEVNETIDRLRDVADYFHEQAAKSWTEQRKLPD